MNRYVTQDLCLKMKPMICSLSPQRCIFLPDQETCKIIGLTLETRPDTITVEELRRFRRYGCTRVQLGVQHTADKILKKINRGCKTADTVRATASESRWLNLVALWSELFAFVDSGD